MALPATRRPFLRHISRQTSLVAAFLLILANSAFALLMFRELHEANDLVAHTQQVVAALQDVRELIRQAGAGQRGYLYTGDRNYLPPYEAAERGLPPLLARLKALTADNAQQIRRISRLGEQIDADRQRLADGITRSPVALERSLSPELVASRLETNALAASVGPILDGERDLLQERIAAAELRNAFALALIVFGTTVSVTVIGLMLYRLQDEARARNTELAGTDAALRESEQRFRRVFEESPLAILLVDSESQRIVQANPAFCAMLGYEAAEFPGKSMAEITHVDDRELLEDASRRTAEPGYFIEIRYVTRSGALTWARVRMTRLSTSDQHAALLLCLLEDITRQKQVEAELRQAQKMEAIGQLTGGIAHDFNNLLGVIIGNVEFLIDAVAGKADQTELASEILNSALSGADLTRRLLAFARRQTLQPRRIDLNAYLPNHIAILRRLLGETIEMTTTLAHNLWLTRADPSQVGDALLNLAINARDAMPHGGRLSIETANVHLTPEQPDADVAPGDYIVLSVTDTGTGMAPEVLERVLEPFFTTKGPGAGSGLGLSMIYGFAKQSGGHLRIDSELGLGTKVRLYLPRAIGGEPDEERSMAEENLPSGYETVLLVDDNAEMRSAARRHLVSLGYRVSEAANGPAALTVLEGDERVDLLFTDVVMPEGLTGYQLAVAAQQLRPGIKVLFTTGYTRPRAGGEADAPHSGVMIRKPYRKQELAVMVRAALQA